MNQFSSNTLRAYVCLLQFLLFGCDAYTLPDPSKSIQTIGFQEDDFGNAIAETSDGGFIVAASSHSFRGNRDAYIIKLDPSGVTQWSKAMGGDNQDEFSSVVESKNGDFLFAGTVVFGENTDIYVVRTDQHGKLLWSKTFGGQGLEVSRSIYELANDDIVLFGSTRSFGHGGSDFYLLRLNKEGNLVWSQTYGTVRDETGARMIVAKNGDFVMTGTQQFVIRDTTYHVNDDGIPIPSVSLTSESDALTMRVNQMGSILWQKIFDFDYSPREDGTFDVANSVIETSAGNIVIAGKTGYIHNRIGTEFRIFSNVLIVAYSSSGDYIYRGSFNSTDYDEATDLVENASGFMLFGSSYASISSDDKQFYFVQTKLPRYWPNPGGIPFTTIDTAWTKNFGDVGADNINQVIITKNGDLRLIGSTQSMGAGKSDLILIHMDKYGSLKK